MYMDESTNTVVKEGEPVSTVDTIQTLGVKPETEIISAEKIAVKDDNGDNIHSTIYRAKA